MRSGYTGHIQAGEWRWVVIVGIVLVLLAFAPFLWTALSGTSNTPWQFMGVLHNYPDGATYLSKMHQGGQGIWLVQFRHTPEPHNGAIVAIVYPLLGQISRVISLSPIVVFHIARVGVALFMFTAIYQLGATVWTRVRTRRVFFVLAALGSGFGWILVYFTGDATYPDLNTPQIYPFYSTFINVHFPLAIACLALIASILIAAFRPGAEEKPSVNNGGLMAFILSLALAFLYPEALVPVGITLAICVGRSWMKERRISTREAHWVLWVIVPALPVVVYDLLTVLSNPAMADWGSQNVSPAPNPLMLLLALGFPLVIAVPGLYRAVRRFEPDGDQFMLLWLVVMLVAAYFPGTTVQARFLIALMIPVAYFATRALDDVWFRVIQWRWRFWAFYALIPIMAGSQLFALFVPVSPLFSGHPENARGLVLERDYLGVFEWLDLQADDGDVVLTSPNVGIWLPVWTDLRPVYGHPVETLDAAQKRKAVLEWYRSSDPNECQQLLDGKYTFNSAFAYRVSYVIVGPEELALGAADCVGSLRPVFRYGSVSVYAP